MAMVCGCWTVILFLFPPLLSGLGWHPDGLLGITQPRSHFHRYCRPHRRFLWLPSAPHPVFGFAAPVSNSLADLPQDARSDSESPSAWECCSTSLGMVVLQANERAAWDAQFQVLMRDGELLSLSAITFIYLMHFSLYRSEGPCLTKVLERENWEIRWLFLPSCFFPFPLFSHSYNSPDFSLSSYYPFQLLVKP